MCRQSGLLKSVYSLNAKRFFVQAVKNVFRQRKISTQNKSFIKISGARTGTDSPKAA